MISLIVARLRNALKLIKEGDLANSRVELRRASQEGIDNPALALAAASLLFTTRNYHDSLAMLDLAFSLGAGPIALWRKYQEAMRLGWEQDARIALETGAAMEPKEPRWRAALLALHARRRDRKVALHHGEALLAIKPRAGSALIEMASLYAAQGDEESARRSLAAALALPLRDEARLEVARIYRSLGAFAEARALLEPLTQGSFGIEARLLLAELALWSGDLVQAEALASSLDQHAARPRILGAIAVIRGHRDQARLLLEEALRLDPNESEAHTWLAELLPEQGRYEQAHHQLTQAQMTARGALFVGHLLRIRINLCAGTSPPSLDLAQIEHLLPTFAHLCPERLLELRKGDLEAWRQAIELCLARLHGNRSITPTILRGSFLEKLPVGPEPRAESRRILERIRVGRREDLLAEFAALAEQFPHSGLPHAHRGEFLLWLGEVSEARRALEQAIDVVRGTRWAYIGLTMCDILEGKLEDALVTSARGISIMNNTEGPAVYVHRGEALRRLGRLEEAQRDLERSVAMHGSRVGAWVNLGLLRLAQGSVEGARIAIQQVFALAPGLISDAARAEGVDLFSSPRRLADWHFASVLRRCLELLRGNRSSSCISYLTPEGLLRFGHHGGHTQEPLHDDDEQRLVQAEEMLRRFPVTRSTFTSSKVTVSLPKRKVLSDAQVNFFLEHGYLHLPGAIPRATVDRWVEDSRRRVIEEPERILRNYFPNSTPLDLDRPETWHQPRVELQGSLHEPIAHVAPLLWGAICDLLGGDERVQTQTLNDYFILKFPFPEQEGTEGMELWHIDDPQPNAKLNGLRNGLVCFLLFSDVVPEGGASRLLVGSVSKLARLLAASPSGIDLTDPVWAKAIAAESGTEVPCSGEAGDAFLAHGLMLHRASANRTRRIRWLNNLMIYLKAPLDPLRTDPSLRSPAEEILARAIERSSTASSSPSLP
ncbi:MAG: tetratricopeptide repeat protein [Myxococcales bacterium]|nr:tetratricopeptide repeat protein [Polyangiaceae bacterium]MDW8248134.1 tetratricopeptide repeat protein [Myxococcales bacterium]